MDAAGNVFIAADGTVNSVLKVSATGVQSPVATGLNVPNGVAVDGAGDVFIGDTFNNRVLEISSAGVQTTLPPVTVNDLGLNEPFGVAVDGAGDVFIADWGNGRVVEIAANGTQTTVGSGLITPVGVAVDGPGDVFIADAGLTSIVEVPAGCTSSGCQTTLGSGLDTPSGVSVDAAGDVFIVGAGSYGLVEVPAGCTSSVCQTTVAGTAGLSISGVAVDAAGDVFVANPGVVELPSSQPPTFAFASTAVGSTSTDSPQSVTVQNVGNEQLNNVSPGLSVGTNFTQVTGSPTDCTTSFSLIPGASCDLSINFTPLSVATFSSTAIFTDNALNTSPSATQSITLQGTGVAAVPVITGISPNSGPASGGETVTITGQYFQPGATVLFGATAATSVTVVSAATISVVAPALTPGTVSVTVTNPGGQSVTITNAFTALGPPPGITSVTPNSGLAAGGESISITGQNFQPGATVLFGATAATSVTFNSATSLSVVVPALSAGTVSVLVTNPDGQQALLAGGFLVVAPLPPPTITGVTPNLGFQGQQGLQVTITGSNFVAGTGNTSVTFGGGNAGITVSLLTVNSTSNATAMINIDPSTTPGNYDVVVTVNGAPPPATLVGGFTVGMPISETITVNDAVTITTLINVNAPLASFSTSSLGFGNVAAGTTGTQIITVSNVGKGSTGLVLSGAVISPSGAPFALGPIACSNGATSFSTTLPSGAACLVTIVYTAPASGTPPTATITFTDNAALSNLPSTPTGSGIYAQTITLNGTGTTAAQPIEPPLISSVTPNIGLPGQQGLQVTISGADFVAGATSVTFGGGNAGITVASVTVNSTNNATAVINIDPSTTPGSYDVVVTVNGASSPATLAGGFTVTAVINESITVHDQVSITVSQSITFGSAPTVVVFGNGQLSAVASSGLVPVIFSSTTPVICSVNGSTVTDLAVGSCIVAANQAGNAIYSPAPQVTQTIPIIGLFPLTLTFGDQLVGSTSATQSVTLVNTGSAALTVGTITTTGNFTHPSKTCGTSLRSGSSCTISVAFAPKATGQLNGTLTVGANGTVALSGTGIVPSASITPATYTFANQQVGTTSTVRTFTYTNTTDSNTVPVSITVSSLALTGADPTNYAIADDGCSGVTLAPAATCDVGVTFTPSVANNRTATLTVTDETGGAAKATASLNGTGVAPTASLTGNAAFGKLQVGVTSAAQTLTYQNTGIGPISVSSVSLSGASAGNYVIASDACTGATLAASATCSIGVTLTPSAPGSQTAKLTVTDITGGAPAQSLSLSGTGAAPTINLGSGTLAYGAVKVATAKTFTLTNSGTAPFVISTIALTTGTQFQVTGGTCAIGSSVSNGGGSCTVIVRFTPSGTVFGDTLTVSGSGVGLGAPTYTASRNMTGS